MAELKENPFVGARSYEEQDQDIFFGRESEANDLFQLITINRFTLLYGKSGLGKTSVLQAGVFPKLRKANFLPIYVRLNYRNANANYIKEIELLIKNQIIELGYEFEPLKSKETLWEYLHELQLKTATGKNITLVLILDQFEEIFTLGTEEKSSELRPNTRQFVNFLSELIENSPPEILGENEKLELGFKFGSTPSFVKVLFSFRQEYLGDFYELAKFIPSIAYSNLQYKLSPLNYEKAYNIVNNASKGLFDPAAIQETLITISESKTIEEATKRDIDSFLLSIFCENQVENLKTKAYPLITAKEINAVNIQNLVYSKYQSIVASLALNQEETELLEDRLLSPEGFRWPVYLEHVYSNPLIRNEKIEALLDKKILKLYFIDGKKVIEIIHDKYALSIKTERDFRLKARQKQLQIIKEREELEKRKIEEQRLLVAEKNRLTKHVLIIITLVVVFSSAFIVSTLKDAANTAYSFIAIITIDSVKDTTLALKILTKANANFKHNKAPESVDTKGLEISNKKILTLFNSLDLSGIPISAKNDIIHDYSFLDNDSKILVTFQHNSYNINGPSFYSVLFNRDGSTLTRFNNPARHVENSSFIAELENNRTILYDFKNREKKPITTLKVSLDLSRLQSIQYCAKHKKILIVHDTSACDLYNSEGQLLSANKIQTQTSNKSFFSSENNSIVLLADGNVLIIKTLFQVNSISHQTNQNLSFAVLRGDKDYNSGSGSFINIKEIHVSPSKKEYLYKDSKDEWHLYNLELPIKDAPVDAVVRFDFHDNFVLFANGNINWYDSTGKLKHRQAGLAMPFSQLKDFNAPLILFTEVNNKTKISKLTAYGLQSQKRSTYNIKLLKDCRLSKNGDSLFIVSVIPNKDPIQVNLAYETYSLGKQKCISRLLLYDNVGTDNQVWNNAYSRRDELDFKMDAANQSYAYGNSQSNIEGIGSYSDTKPVNLFSMKSVQTASDLRKIKLFDVQHPKVVFADRQDLITAWINKSLPDRNGDKRKIDQHLHTTTTWTILKDIFK